MGWKTSEENGPSLIRCVEHLNYSAQFNLCTGYTLDQLGLGNGLFRSLIALTLPPKRGEILVRDDLTIALLPQSILLAYLNYKKLFNNQSSHVSLPLMKHQHLKHSA